MISQVLNFLRVTRFFVGLDVDAEAVMGKADVAGPTQPVEM